MNGDDGHPKKSSLRLKDSKWPYLAAADSRNFFNWIDFLVVCSSWTELFAAALPISPTFLRMLRLGKLLRALRVVKMSQVKMGQGIAGHGRAWEGGLCTAAAVLDC